MKDAAKQAAAEHAKRAGTQARHAANNGAKAVEDLAEPVIEAAEEKTEEVVSFLKRVLPSKQAIVVGVVGAAAGAFLYDRFIVNTLGSSKTPPVPPTVPPTA